MLAVEHTYTFDYSTASQNETPHEAGAVHVLLCALGPAQASAQNDTSQQLLELDEEQRNAAFAHMHSGRRRTRSPLIEAF